MKKLKPLMLLLLLIFHSCLEDESGVPKVVQYEDPVVLPDIPEPDEVKDDSVFSILETDHFVELNESIEFGSANSDPDGMVVEWNWDFGDGNISTEKNPSHAYSSPGKKIVQLSTLDVDGLTLEFKDSIYAVDIKWEFPVNNRIRSVSPAVDDNGTVYVAFDGKNQGGFFDNVVAINSDGSQKWVYTTGDVVRSTPAIGNDGNIYIASYDDFLHAINPDTGIGVWSTDLAPGKNPNPVYTSPAIASDGTIYIGTANDTDNFIALNPDGTIKWNLPIGDNVDSTPVIGVNGIIYFAADNGKIYAVEDAGTSANILWENTYGTDTSTSLAIDESGTIYLAGQDKNNSASLGIIIAYNNDGTVKWSHNTIGPITQGGIAVANDHIYVGTKTPELFSFTMDGEIEWVYKDFENVIGTNPAVDEMGNIYVGDDNGDLSVLTKEGILTYRKNLGNKAWSSPTIGEDGVLYFGVDQEGSTSGKFYALETGLTPFPSGWPMKSRNRKHQGR